MAEKIFFFIHVDEFQDVDMLQYDIIRMLVKRWQLFMCGRRS